MSCFASLSFASPLVVSGRPLLLLKLAATMGSFLSSSVLHKDKIVDPKNIKLTELLGRDLSFLHRLLQHARATSQDLESFKEKDVLRRLHFAHADMMWKTFLEKATTDEELEREGERMNFLNLFMTMVLCAHASRALRSAMLFNVFAYELSPFLPEEPTEKDPKQDLRRDEVVVFIERLALGLVQLTGYVMPHADEIDDMVSSLLTEQDAQLDLRVGVREWNHFCRHDRTVQQLFDLCDSLGMAGIRDMGTMHTASRSPERPSKLTASAAPSPNTKKRSTKGSVTKFGGRKKASADAAVRPPSAPFSPTRQGPAIPTRKGIPDRLMRQDRPNHPLATTSATAAATTSENLFGTALYTKTSQELGQEGLMCGAMQVFRDQASLAHRVTVRQIIKNLSKTMDISADALQGLFADSGKYAQDFVTEKDFARIMGQFEFHGSVFAKEIVARLKAQLAEAQKQAVNALAEAQRERINAQKMRRRCVELEQTLAHSHEEMQLLVKTREQAAQEQEDLAEEAMEKRITAVIAELRTMISISSGAIKEQASLLLKLLAADSKREERLLNLVHSTDEGGNEEDNELVRNQLLWSQEKTDQQLSKRQHETSMFLSQASGNVREAKEKLDATEEEVKKYISEIRAIDLRLKDMQLRDDKDAAVEHAIKELQAQRRAVERDEVGQREKATAEQAAYAAKRQDEGALQDLLKLINEARSAKWSCIRESDERSTLTDAVVRRYLNWVGKACSQDVGREGNKPSIPNIVIMVPVPERKKVLLSIPKADLQYEWFGDSASSKVEKTDPFTGRTFLDTSDGSMVLHFLCAYDFSTAGSGYLIPNAREFAQQIMPILQLSLVLLKEAIEAGARMYDLPLPLHSWDQNTVKEMLEIMQMVFVNDEKPMEEQKRVEDLMDVIKATHGHKDKSPDEEGKLIRKLQMTGVSASMWELDNRMDLIDPEGKKRGLCRLTGLDGTEAWVKQENVKQWQLRSAVHLSGTASTAQEHLTALKNANGSAPAPKIRPPKVKRNKQTKDEDEFEDGDVLQELGPPPPLSVNMSPQVGATRRRISISKPLGDGLLSRNYTMHEHATRELAGASFHRKGEEEEVRRRRASLALDLAI